jgi:cytochrome b pre-mRNA-processing protein 3
LTFYSHTVNDKGVQSTGISMVSFLAKNVDAAQIYILATSLARQPELYRFHGVADTPQGRFEMLALHLAIIINYIKTKTFITADITSDRQAPLIQSLCDYVVADVEESLRSMNVSEGKISGRLKKFIEGFYGRLVAYNDALNQKNELMLEDAVRRNIYCMTDSAPAQCVGQMTAYVFQTAAQVQKEGINGFS